PKTLTADQIIQKEGLRLGKYWTDELANKLVNVYGYLPPSSRILNFRLSMLYMYRRNDKNNSLSAPLHIVLVSNIPANPPSWYIKEAYSPD
ncbi:MAG: hypothetical protein ACKPA7_16880, partial [Sphaerospermopsis kisseleviana]